jgi:tetratricopeptide (TPR) repeat protein
MNPRTLALLAVIAWALVAGGCAEAPTKAQQPAPAAPQITEDVLRARATEQLAQGVRQYDAGEYDNAVKSLTASLDHGLLSKPDQARARKYLAFTHCASGRDAQCRTEFRKAFEIYSEFALTPAEDGHPIWGPVYRDVRNQLISEREATAGSQKSLLPLGKAEQELSDGIVSYEAGKFADAEKHLESALKQGLKDKRDQVRAMKHLAFSLCLENKWVQCRTTFVKIYEIDPGFDLAAAEAGHPSWAKTFAQAKAQAKKMLADKAAKEAREKAAPEKAPATKK